MSQEVKYGVELPCDVQSAGCCDILTRVVQQQQGTTSVGLYDDILQPLGCRNWRCWRYCHRSQRCAKYAGRCIRANDAGMVAVSRSCRRLQLLSLHGLRLVTDRCRFPVPFLSCHLFSDGLGFCGALDAMVPRFRRCDFPPVESPAWRAGVLLHAMSWHTCPPYRNAVRHCQ